MSRFISVTCSQCKKRYTWVGKFIDCPPCPRCGHQPSQKSLEQEDRETKTVEDVIFGKQEEEE